MPIDPDDICKDGGVHEPDWDTVTVEHDGDEIYVDVSCIKCGRSGCIGTEKTLTENITW